jgi:hypothetical protein
MWKDVTSLLLYTPPAPHICRFMHWTVSSQRNYSRQKFFFSLWKWVTRPEMANGEHWRDERIFLHNLEFSLPSCSPHPWKFIKVQTGPRFAHGFQPSVSIRLHNKIVQATSRSHTESWAWTWCAVQDKAKPDLENIRVLNLAVVNLTTVQVTKLPL